MKRCKICGVLKPLEEFYRASGARDGYRSDCKVCNLARKKIWYADNREIVIAKVKKWQRENRDRHNATQREYRSTHQAEYDELLARQGGGCGICGRAPGKISLHVDHDHETGEIRGLLCVGCNNALGQFHDDPHLLNLAADYVSCDVRPFVHELELIGVVRERARHLQNVIGTDGRREGPV
jgi:Recombination endonuclease VII